MIRFGYTVFSLMEKCHLGYPPESGQALWLLWPIKYNGRWRYDNFQAYASRAWLFSLSSSWNSYRISVPTVRKLKPKIHEEINQRMIWGPRTRALAELPSDSQPCERVILEVGPPSPAKPPQLALHRVYTDHTFPVLPKLQVYDLSHYIMEWFVTQQ